MFRLFTFLLLVTIVSIIAVWFIENDGSVAIEWMGYHIETSVAFLSLASLILIVILTSIVQICLMIWEYPKRYKKYMLDKRKDKGLTALTEGFVAVASGDSKQANNLTKKANQYLGNIPITKLLSAQTAQLSGNNDLAKNHYNSMLEDKETELIAIKGLLIQAKQDKDLNKAIFLAKRAIAASNNANWAILILLDLYTKTKKWDETKEILKLALKKKLIEKHQANRSLAIIGAAKCRDYMNIGDLKNALREISKSNKIINNYAPFVGLYASALIKSGNSKKAARIIELCWKQNATAELATIYMNIFENLPFDKQLRQVSKLLKVNSTSIESHIAVAITALNADDFDKARNHLRIALSSCESSRICNLMAEIQRRDNQPAEEVSKWLERAALAGPTESWRCDSCDYRTAHWSENCPNCDEFDSLYWDKPIREEVITDDDRLIGAEG